MSFFDDDEPTGVTSRSRRPARPAAPRQPSQPPPSGGGKPPTQTVRTRQAVALGAGILLLVLIVLGVNSCVNSRTERALKDYNRDVGSIITDSDKQVAQPFFQTLSSGKASGGDLQVQVNQIRLTAEDDVKRARELNVPKAMRPAQQNLLLTLNLREAALTAIAGKLKTAQGRGQAAETATAEIAGQMQAFLASDVVYSQRTAPLIKQTLDEEGISGQTIVASRSLPGYTWLAPDTIASAIGGTASSGTSGGGGTVAPGSHGHGLTSTAIGDVTLQPGGASNSVPGSPQPTVDVTFQNQGDNDEKNVVVSVSLTRPGAKTISEQKKVNTTTAGESSTVAIPLGTTIPAGTAGTLKVKIGAVPGEKVTDNNESTYTVLFTG